MEQQSLRRLMASLESTDREVQLRALAALRDQNSGGLRVWWKLRALCGAGDADLSYFAAATLIEQYRRGVDVAVGPLVRFNARYKSAPDATMLALMRRHPGRFEREVIAHLKADERAMDHWEAALRALPDGGARVYGLALEDERESLRARALRALREAPVGVGACVSERIRDLAEGDQAGLVVSANVCLARIDPEYSDRASRRILDCLHSPDAATRRQAIEALAGVRVTAETIVPRLIKRLADPDLEVRRAARDTLLALGPKAVSGLLTVTTPDEEEALNLVRKIGAQAVPVLLDVVHGGSNEVMSRGVRCLTLLAKDHPDRVEGWVRMARADEVTNLRLVAMLEGLEAASGSERIPIELARELKRSADPEVRRAVAGVLGWPPRKDRMETLIEMLDDPVARVREKAVDALGRGREESTGAIKPLMKMLRDEALDVRASAANAIARISPDAGVMFPGLLQAFTGRPGDSAQRAEDGAQRFMLHLTEKLGSEDAAVVMKTLEKIRRLGSRGLSLLPQIGRCLRHGDLWVRVRAMECIKDYGQFAADLLPEVVLLTGDPDWYIRQLAYQCLVVLDPEGATAVDPLRVGLADAHELVRKEVIRSLGVLGSSAGAARPDLLELMETTGGATRQEIERALEKIGAPDLTAARRAGV